MKIFTKLVAALTLLIVANLKAFSQSTSECGYDIDLSQYKTYDFRPGRTYLQGQRERHNKALEQKVNSSIAAQLNQRGLTQVSSNPDLLVTYTYGVKEIARMEIKSPMYAGPVFYTPEGIWAGTWTNWWLRTSDVSTLRIDVRDSRTNNLVYRIDGTGDVKKPKKQQKEFDRIAEKGFVCFRK